MKFLNREEWEASVIARRGVAPDVPEWYAPLLARVTKFTDQLEFDHDGVDYVVQTLAVPSPYDTGNDLTVYETYVRALKYEDLIVYDLELRDGISGSCPDEYRNDWSKPIPEEYRVKFLSIRRAFVRKEYEASVAEYAAKLAAEEAERISSNSTQETE